MVSFFKHTRMNKVNEEMKGLEFPTDRGMKVKEGSDDGFYESFDELETDFDEIKNYDIVYKNGEGGLYVDEEVQKWEDNIGQAITKIHQIFDKFGEVIDEFDGEVTEFRANASNSYTQRSRIKTEFEDFLVIMNLNLGSLNYDVRQFSITVLFDDTFEGDNLIEKGGVEDLSEAFDEDSPIKESDLHQDYEYEMTLKFMSNTNFSEAFGSDEDDDLDWSILEDVSRYDKELKEEVEKAREEGTEDELVQKYKEEGVKREDIRPHIDEIREEIVNEYKNTIKFVNRVL